MKIVAILVIGYFALGFFGTSLVLEALHEKPKTQPWYKPEPPPLQIPMTILLAVIFLALPLLGYKRARRNGDFLHVGPKIWLWGPISLALAGVLTALVTFAVMPSLFASS